MTRRWLILGALVALLIGGSVAAPASAQQTRPAVPAPTAPAVPPAANNPLSDPPMFTVGRVLGVVAGTAVGELLLHSVLGIPALPSVIVGGWAGWYVYTKYVEPELEHGARKISAVADEARLYWIGLMNPG